MIAMHVSDAVALLRLTAVYEAVRLPPRRWCRLGRNFRACAEWRPVISARRQRHSTVSLIIYTKLRHCIQRAVFIHSQFSFLIFRVKEIESVEFLRGCPDLKLAADLESCGLAAPPTLGDQSPGRNTRLLVGAGAVTDNVARVPFDLVCSPRVVCGRDQKQERRRRRQSGRQVAHNVDPPPLGGAGRGRRPPPQ